MHQHTSRSGTRRSNFQSGPRDTPDGQFPPGPLRLPVTPPSKLCFLIKSIVRDRARSRSAEAAKSPPPPTAASLLCPTRRGPIFRWWMTRYRNPNGTLSIPRQDFYRVASGQQGAAEIYSAFAAASSWLIIGGRRISDHPSLWSCSVPPRLSSSPEAFLVSGTCGSSERAILNDFRVTG